MAAIDMFFPAWYTSPAERLETITNYFSAEEGAIESMLAFLSKANMITLVIDTVVWSWSYATSLLDPGH